MRKTLWVGLGIMAVMAVLVFFGYLKYLSPSSRTRSLLMWLKNPAAHPDWTISAGEHCSDAVLLLPTDGMIGYIWDDSFRLGQRHQLIHE